MKNLVLCTLLCALSIPVVAQTVEKPETVTITDTGLRITIPEKRFRMLPEDFYEFKGAYSLSNGGTLILTNRGSFMFARLAGQDWHQIIATAHNAFVALDRQMKMRIDLHENGDASGELIFIVPSQEQAKLEDKKDSLLRIAYLK